MDTILKWLEQYSAPIVVLLGCGAALIFFFQFVVEKTVEAEFEKSNKRFELLLQRRSNFEEKILLDQYETITQIQLKLANIAANLNRLRNGIEVEGLMKGSDIVPLTDVYIDLQTKRYLLRQEFYDLLTQEADNLLSMANAKTPDEVSRLGREYSELNELLGEQMDRAFGIKSISWNAIGGVDR